MGARSCGCTGRSVHHQTRMQLDFLSLGSELYVVIESHRASRVHIDVGGGALSSVSCHHHQKAGGGCPSFWVFLAKVVGGGDFAAPDGAPLAFIQMGSSDATPLSVKGWGLL